MAAAAVVGLRPCWDGQQEGTLHKPVRLHAARCNGRAQPSARLSPLLQVMVPLLLSEENVAGWPGVVVEDIVRQAHRLKNEMFVMGGKIQGKPLLPLPEHLIGQDGSSTVLDWWVLLVLLGAGKAWLGPGGARVPLGGTGAGTPSRSLSIPGHSRRAPPRGSRQAAVLAEVATSRRTGLLQGGSGPVPVLEHNPTAFQPVRACGRFGAALHRDHRH